MYDRKLSRVCVCVSIYIHTCMYYTEYILCVDDICLVLYIFCALVLYTLFVFPPTVQSLVLHPYFFWPPTRIVAIIRELKCNEDTSSLSCVSKRYSCGNVYQLTAVRYECMYVYHLLTSYMIRCFYLDNSTAF